MTGAMSLAIESAKRARETPCLFFDLDRMRLGARALQQIGDAHGVRFLSAVKALPTQDLLSAADSGGGFDVSNIGELRRLADWHSGAALPYVSLTGPCLVSADQRPTRFIDRLAINLETEEQMGAVDSLAPWAHRIEIGVRIALRLYPGDPPPLTRFGLASADAIALMQHPDFTALHCHLEGDLRPTGSFVTAAHEMMALIASAGRMPRMINLGGGLRGETLQELEHICADLRRIIPEEIEIVLEPGAWLTSAAGFALARVLWQRDMPGLDATVVTLDLSREIHLRWCTPELIRWWGKPPSKGTALLFGPTCAESDHLGAFRVDAAAVTGAEHAEAWLLFGGVSGYAAAFNTEFNGIAPAKVVMVGAAVEAPAQEAVLHG